MLAVCDIGIRYFDDYANNAQFPNIRKGRLTISGYIVYLQKQYLLWLINVHMFIYWRNHCIILVWISVGPELAGTAKMT